MKDRPVVGRSFFISKNEDCVVLVERFVAEFGAVLVDPHSFGV
ncbi:hypothetical protein FUAX_31950 [Fulvitalea axinellae]|uniref:Uncharacterized protein n=1 Tax=Fulvitalea axinellae TaxID=1182444 RepID=A0AAU9D477_9BACT|nr:hypothetical protein FUAX_31950 [Fulvitalea axinellae]